MGLLDSVIGAMAGGNRGAAGGGLGGLLGGGGGVQGALLTAVIGLLANGAMGGGAAAGQGAQAQAGGMGGGMGGLGDLMSKFSRGGMGDVMNSWVGAGQNAPISGDQLSNVLGNDTIGNLAKQLGLSHEETAGQLSQMLPEVVDKLTPNGQTPAGGLGSIGDIFAQLSKR